MRIVAGIVLSLVVLRSWRTLFRYGVLGLTLVLVVGLALWDYKTG